MIEIEKWKDIPDYEGYYQASTFGQIQSLDREIRHSTSGGFYIKKGKILKQYLRVNYLSINLSKNSISNPILVHTVMAITFLKHKQGGRKIHVNHIDFNKRNNRLENLELISSRDNLNRKHLKSTSKYIGVYWDKNCNKWRSKIYIKPNNIQLGSFDIEYDAHLAYEKALKNHLKKEQCCTS